MLEKAHSLRDSWFAPVGPIYTPGRECRSTCRNDSVGRSVYKHELQLAEDQILSSPSIRSLHNTLGGNIKHPTKRIVIGEAGLICRDLLELIFINFCAHQQKEK